MNFLFSLRYADVDYLFLIQDYKRNAFMEADLRCTSAIQSMEKQLRAACHASNANMDNVVKVGYLWIYIFRLDVPRMEVPVVLVGC